MVSPLEALPDSGHLGIAHRLGERKGAVEGGCNGRDVIALRGPGGVGEACDLFVGASEISLGIIEGSEMGHGNGRRADIANAGDRGPGGVDIDLGGWENRMLARGR